VRKRKRSKIKKRKRSKRKKRKRSKIRKRKRSKIRKRKRSKLMKESEGEEKEKESFGIPANNFTISRIFFAWYDFKNISSLHKVDINFSFYVVFH
jgi:hypothetical protein